MRRLGIYTVVVLIGAGVAFTAGTTSGVAAVSTAANASVQVSGSPLSDITAGPLTLTPAFAPTITDYVLRCQAGANSVRVTFTSIAGGTINVGSRTGASVGIQEILFENQALIVSAPDPSNLGGPPVQYWIRCLPHDFPQLKVTRPGAPPAGWYLTGNGIAPVGTGTYAMVLDNNGTPVWYQKSAGVGAINLTLLLDGTLAWMSSSGANFGVDANGAFQDFNLTTGATGWISAPIPPTDLHELHQMPNGDLMMLSSPLVANVDMTALGIPTKETIVDCVVQEVDPAGHLVWEWRASDHIAVGESAYFPKTVVNRQSAYDVYHCNSIDTDPVSGNVLVSSRHTNAVYLIDKPTGTVLWKMGGKPVNKDRAQILAVTGDPEGVFRAQHDARFQPNGDVSLYDDQTWDTSIAARGVEYHVDTAAGTASLVWSFAAPDGRGSPATGSFTRLYGGTDNVIGWGYKTTTLFTEVDASGKVMLNVTFPNGDLAYRVIKVAPTALDANLLRATAGLPQFVRTAVPTVAFVGPVTGPPGGGGTVSITGKGFTGASAVSFGSDASPSFVVKNDGLITATVPAGHGAVSVVVATPSGTSSPTPANELLTTASDSLFASGTGSWSSDENAELALITTPVKGGTYSLQVTPKTAGGDAALTGRYPVPVDARITGNAWVLSTGSDQVGAFLRFYDASGKVLATDEGPLKLAGPSAWNEVFETAVGPAATASVAFGVADTYASSPVFIDDAALFGSNQYVYLPAAKSLTGPSPQPTTGPTVSFAVVLAVLVLVGSGGALMWRRRRLRKS